MMRLIDADELLNIPIRVTGEIPIKNGHVQPIEAISVREIENAPTIDPGSGWKVKSLKSVRSVAKKASQIGITARIAGL